jgi:membrane protein YqaA with SNARE-associated domain
MWFAFICTLASVLGAVFGYIIGKYGGRPLLNKLFKQEKILIVEKYYQKYDVWAVGIAGFTPIPYKVFTISSGVFHMDIIRFLIASVLSRGARFFMVAGFIYIFGESIKPFIDKYFELITVIFTVLLIGSFYILKFHSKLNLAGKKV